MSFEDMDYNRSMISIPLEPLIKDYDRRTNDHSYFEFINFEFIKYYFCFQCCFK